MPKMISHYTGSAEEKKDDISGDIAANVNEVSALEEYIETEMIYGSISSDVSNMSSSKRPLLGLYDFLSYTDADYLISMGTIGSSEGNGDALWNIFDNNSFFLVDTRFTSGAEYYLYRVKKDNTCLYVGIYRDMGNKMLYATYLIKGVDELYMESSVLNEMW